MDQVTLWDAFLLLKLTNLRRHSQKLESMLASEAARIAQDLKEEGDALPEEERDDFFQYAADEYGMLNDDIPNALRYALFVRAYSILEHGLMEVAGALQRRGKIPLEVKDLAHKGIFKAHLYLTKVVGVQLPDDSAHWKAIVALNKIRNAIAHQEGALSSSSNEIKQLRALPETKADVRSVVDLE